MEQERNGYKSLGTLSNLDDEPSGHRPEVFWRSQQHLRMSVMSSTWRSGLLFHCLYVLRCTCLPLESQILTIFRILFQVNLNEPIVVYLLRRQTNVCLLKHLFFLPWTMFSTQTSLVFSHRRPQMRPGCLRSLFKSISPLTILAEKKQNDWAEVIQMTHQINPYRVSQIYDNLSKPTISMPILPRFYNSKNDRQEVMIFTLWVT